MPKIKRLVLVLLLFLLFPTLIFLQKKTIAEFKKTTTTSNVYYLPPSNWIKFFSIGYNEASASLIWVQTILYFSTSPKMKVKKGTFHKSNSTHQTTLNTVKNYTLNYILTITDLDPRFKSAYTNGSTLTMYHQGTITRQTIEMAIDILDRGISQFPEDGNLFFNLGFLYYYEMKPFVQNDKELEQFKVLGTKYIQKSSILKNSPPYAARLADSLLSRHGLDELVIEHLQQQLSIEQDETIREYLKKQLLKELGQAAQRDLQYINHLHAKWEKEYSFINFDFFSMIAPAEFQLTHNEK